VIATVTDKRPVNLDLTTIKFPLPAIASISHRISGIALFFAMPFLLWALDRSLASPEGFEQVRSIMATPLASLITWLILAALLFHLLAGVRHLIMDMGWGESLQAGRRSAAVVFAAFVVLMILAGVWIW
jgi:succinate dehydrogenase / fumarate reductase cytochrome b subunit